VLVVENDGEPADGLYVLGEQLGVLRSPRRLGGGGVDGASSRGGGRAALDDIGRTGEDRYASSARCGDSPPTTAARPRRRGAHPRTEHKESERQALSAGPFSATSREIDCRSDRVGAALAGKSRDAPLRFRA